MISNRLGFLYMTFALTLLYCLCNALGYSERHFAYWYAVLMGVALGVVCALWFHTIHDFVSNIITITLLYGIAIVYSRLLPAMNDLVVWVPAVLMTSIIMTMRYYFFDHVIGRMHFAIRNTTLLMEKESQ